MIDLDHSKSKSRNSSCLFPPDCPWFWSPRCCCCDSAEVVWAPLLDCDLLPTIIETKFCLNVLVSPHSIPPPAVDVVVVVACDEAGGLLSRDPLNLHKQKTCRLLKQRHSAPFIPKQIDNWRNGTSQSRPFWRSLSLTLAWGALLRGYLGTILFLSTNRA